ncbi:MAG: hypothetical protein LQ350_008222 [Teloschistes chrysophthalmus]|nr:MAG: hypothetical protein LQ350_008222 [Niorma chrysophthalma]
METLPNELAWEILSYIVQSWLNQDEVNSQSEGLVRDLNSVTGVCSWWRSIFEAQVTLVVKHWTDWEFQKHFLRTASCGFALGLDILCDSNKSNRMCKSVLGGPAVNLESNAVQIAAAEGRTGALDVLIRRGVAIDISYQPYGHTPLWLAVHSESQSTVKLLLDAGAALDSTASAEGRTALFGAVVPLRTACSRHPTLHYLLKRGADPEIRDNHGCKVMHYAASLGLSQVVDSLINFDALVDDPDDDTTPLMMACEGHQPQLVRQLLQNGAVVDRLSGDGKTALVRLVQAFRSVIDVESIDILLHYRADVNEGSSGTAPLFFALEREDPHLIKILLRAGARTEGLDWMARSALQVLCGDLIDGDHCLETLLLLLEFGANPDASSTYRESPLRLVATSQMIGFDQRRAMMDTLIQGGANLEAVDRAGCTVLAAVLQAAGLSIEERVAVAHFLLERHADVHRALAARRPSRISVEMLELLQEYGAIPGKWWLE